MMNRMNIWIGVMAMKIKNKIKEASLKKVYEKCKPGMLKKFGRILSYEEFVEYLAIAHERKMV